jgi:hypothetical protein
MRRLSTLAAKVLAGVLTWFAWPEAAAQSAQSAQTAQSAWTEPAGRFGLDFQASGWTELHMPSDNEGLVLAIEHRPFQERGLMRTCLITERGQDLGGQVSQADINTRTAAVGQSMIERTIGVPAHSAVLDVDGVTVVAATIAAPLRQEVRLFYLSEGTRLTQILINCGATNPVAPDVVDNIAALLGTLHIDAR